MQSERRVLIVEDDVDLVNLLTIHLKDLGYLVDCASSGTEGLEKFLGGSYTLTTLFSTLKLKSLTD